jgi:hypothetical protein
MVSGMVNFLAALSAVGLILSFIVHCGALMHYPQSLASVELYLFYGFAVTAALLASNWGAPSGIEKGPEFWKSVFRTCPRWVSVLAAVSFVYAMIRYLLSLQSNLTAHTSLLTDEVASALLIFLYATTLAIATSGDHGKR